MKTGLRAQAPGLIVTLVSGIIVGVLAVSYAISFTSIAFAGEFSPLLDRAIGIGLFSAAIMAAITALTASYPGTIGGPQDVAAAVLALALGSAVASLPADASPDQIYATAYSTLTIASFLTALFFLALGYFKLGNLVRTIPYPVMAGFLAATGWLLVKGALGLMTGVTLSLDNIGVLADGQSWFVWVPGIALGLLMLVCTWHFKQPLLFPSLIICTLILFYLVLALFGITPDEARANGWLLGPFSGQGFVGSIDPTLITQVDGLPSLRTFVEIITVMVLSAFGMLLNVSGIEAATRRNVDLNRDLMASSLANFASSFGGGIVGYQTLSLTLLANRLSADNRMVGLIAAGVCALVFFYGASILGYFPKMLIGSIVAYLGFDLLFGSLYREWSRLPLLDFLIILAIVVIAASVGFLEGIATGILAGTIMFVVTYSNISVIRKEYLGNVLRSNVDRSKGEEAILKEQGVGTLVLELHGFLFFGTASQFFDSAREKIVNGEHETKRLIVDFKRVTGLDSTATDSFTKLAHFMQDQNVSLVFSGLTKPIASRFFSDQSEIRTFKDLDGAIEWCENDTLEQSGLASPEHSKSLKDLLSEDCFTAANAKAAMKYLVECAFEPGDVLLQQGSPSDDILFIEEGRVTVHLEAANGTHVRLRSMGPGTVVGEIGHYLGLARTASVVADEPCRAWQLSEKALAKMERTDPALLIAFHKFMARRLSQKLADTTRSLDAVMQ